VLAKLQAFLPQLEAANKALHAQLTLHPERAKELDVNEVAEDERHIAMDIALVNEDDSDSDDSDGEEQQ
jgi:hypothetical protein